MPSSTKWRVYITETDSTYATIREITMRTSVNGANVCTGGVASSSSIYSAGYEASKAFDGNISTAWGSASSASPHWIQYEFPTAQSIVECTVLAHNYPAELPRNFQLQYWDGAAWITTFARTGETGWLTGELRVFSAVAKVEWRLYFPTARTASVLATIREIEMRAVRGGADLCTGGTAAADSAAGGNPALRGFDDTTTPWASASGVSYPHWIRYVFTQPQDVVEYAIQSFDATETPVSWQLQYGDGAGGWVTSDTRTNEPVWGGSETRTYPPAFSAIARPRVFVCT